jgi:hypothetical protein
MDYNRHIDQFFENSTVHEVFDEFLRYLIINPNYTHKKILDMKVFQEILKHINSSFYDLTEKNNKLKHKLEEHSKKIEFLENHNKFMIGGAGYYDAKNHFESIRK